MGLVAVMGGAIGPGPALAAPRDTTLGPAFGAHLGLYASTATARAAWTLFRRADGSGSAVPPVLCPQAEGDGLALVVPLALPTQAEGLCNRVRATGLSCAVVNAPCPAGWRALGDGTAEGTGRAAAPATPPPAAASDRSSPTPRADTQPRSPAPDRPTAPSPDPAATVAYVQVGAFKTLDRARLAWDRLEQRIVAAAGPDPLAPLLCPLPDRSLIRLVVPCPDAAAADRLCDRLTADGVACLRPNAPCADAPPRPVVDGPPRTAGAEVAMAPPSPPPPVAAPSPSAAVTPPKTGPDKPSASPSTPLPSNAVTLFEGGPMERRLLDARPLWAPPPDLTQPPPRAGASASGAPAPGDAASGDAASGDAASGAPAMGTPAATAPDPGAANPGADRPDGRVDPVQALARAARTALTEGRFAEAARLAQTLADADKPEGWYLLALMQASGQGQPRDPEAAFGLMQAAAQAGLADAQNTLGVFFLKGLGTPRNRERGLYWLSRAADQGNALARRNLAEAQGTPSPPQGTPPPNHD